MKNFKIFDIYGHTENNSLPWLLQNKLKAGPLAGTKFFMFIGRWLAVGFYHAKTIYDYYKYMHRTQI